MPYKSLQQERFFHSPGAKKAGITNAEIKEFDQSSKGKKMPKFAKMRKMFEGGKPEDPAKFGKMKSSLRR